MKKLLKADWRTIVVFIIGVPIAFFVVAFGNHPPPPKYVNGHEIVMIGTHEYIIERGIFGSDVLTHYEDCSNPVHKICQPNE